MEENSPNPTRPNVRLQRKNIPSDELLDDLRRVAGELGSVAMSSRDYELTGKFDASTFMARFGSWNSALTAAGLEAFQSRMGSDELLFENLLEVWTKLGRQPTFRDMRRPLSRSTSSPYLTRFGTWNEALIAFARHVNADSEQQSSATPEQRRDSTKRTPRSPNLRLRWKVLDRDHFRCKCGRSPATDQSVVLHVDHVIAWSNGGETVLENLQTLCERCNLGKGAM